VSGILGVRPGSGAACRRYKDLQGGSVSWQSEASSRSCPGREPLVAAQRKLERILGRDAYRLRSREEEVRISPWVYKDSDRKQM